MNRKLNISELHPQIICIICAGYIIDATTITECLHSFCRSCIVKRFQTKKFCPICEVLVHKTKPLMNIRRDKTLQDIIYKLVPGLYANEMKRRRKFYQERPHYIKPDDVESGGDVSDDTVLNFSEDSYIIALTYHEGVNESPRYLKCPVGVTIKHLHKLMLAKFGLNGGENAVEVFLKGQPLHIELSLLDISYLYLWRPNEPLQLTYLIYERGIKKPSPSVTTEPVNETAVKDPEDAGKMEGPVEKEVQLQITETGVMKISDMDSTLLYSDPGHLNNAVPYGVPHQNVVFENNAGPVSSPLPEIINVSLGNAVPNTILSCLATVSSVGNEVPISVPPKTVATMEVAPPSTVSSSLRTLFSTIPPKSKETDRNVVASKLAGQKRLSLEKDSSRVVPKRRSLDIIDLVNNNGDKQNEAVSNCVNIVKEKLHQSENQSAGVEIPEVNCAVTNERVKAMEESNELERRLGEEGKRDKGVKPLVAAGQGSKPDCEKDVRHESPRKQEEEKRDDEVKEAPVVTPTTCHEVQSSTSLQSMQRLSEKPRQEVEKPNKAPKGIRSDSQMWYPEIKKKTLRPTLLKNSDEPPKESKIYKRAVPRYLGNPASRVKPMYSNGMPPAAPPVPVAPPRARVDQKPPNPRPTTPQLQGEKKTPNSLLTSPFIPRDNHLALSNPKTSHPLSPTKHPFSPAFHKSLPPSVTQYLTAQQPLRSVRVKDETGCDSMRQEPPEPSTSSNSSNKQREEALTAVESLQEPAKCSS